MKKFFVPLLILFAAAFIITTILEREAQAWGADILVRPNQPGETMSSPSMVSTSSHGYFIVSERIFEIAQNASETCLVVMHSTDRGQSWQQFFEYCGGENPTIAVPEKTQDYVYVVFDKSTEIGLLKIDLQDPSRWTSTTIASLPKPVQNSGPRLHNAKIITDNRNVTSYSLFVTYIEETLVNNIVMTQSMVQVSTDKGLSWGTPAKFGTSELVGTADYVFYATSDIAYANGKLYLAYTDTVKSNIVKTPDYESYDLISTIYVAVSDNKGVTWTAPVALAVDTHFMGWPSPRIAAIHDGTAIMVVYASADTPGIMYAYSTDGGIIWQKNNQIPGTTQSDFHFMQSLTVDPTLGSFHLAFAADWLTFAAAHSFPQSVYYTSAPATSPSGWSSPVRITDAFTTEGSQGPNAGSFLINSPTIAVDWISGQPGITWSGYQKQLLFDQKDFSSVASIKPKITVTDSVVPKGDLKIPFGNVTLGQAPDQIVTLTNAGNDKLVIGTIAKPNPLTSPFEIPGDSCSGMTLSPRESCGFSVRFVSSATGSFSDTFDIPSNDPDNPTVIMSVSGTGVSAGTLLAPVVVITDSASPSDDLQITFGNVTAGMIAEQSVTIANSGNSNLIIGAIAGADPVAAPFIIPFNNCTGNQIPPSGSCTLTVRFIPIASGNFNDTFDIPSNDPNNPAKTVSLSGTGVAPSSNNQPSIPVLVSPTNGQTGLGTTVTFTWKKSTDPDGDAVLYHLTYCTDQSFSNCSPVTVGIKKASAALGFGGILSLGMLLTRRKRIISLMLLGGVLSLGIMLSCHGGGGGGGNEGGGAGGGGTPPANADEVSFQVSNLNPGTVYFWKVVADDSRGGTAQSEVWSFKTQ